MPWVANFSSRQATMEPRSWEKNRKCYGLKRNCHRGKHQRWRWGWDGHRPEILAVVDTPTKRPNACANEAMVIPWGVLGPFSVSLVKAIPEPCPAKTKINVLMNSLCQRRLIKCTGMHYILLQQPNCYPIGWHFEIKPLRFYPQL